MNVGGISFDINLKGIRQAIKDTSKYKGKLHELESTMGKLGNTQRELGKLRSKLVDRKDYTERTVRGYRNQQKALAAYMRTLRGQGALEQQVLKHNGLYSVALKRISTAQEQVAQRTRQTARATKAYKQSLKQVSGFKAFSQQADAMKRQSAATAQAREQMKRMHTEALRMDKAFNASRMKPFNRVVRDIAIDIRKLITYLKSLLAIFAQTSVGVSNISEKMKYAGLTVNRYTRASKRLRTASTKVDKSVKKQAHSWGLLSRRMRSSGADYSTWWKRFGVIAIGFAVAYRAIYAFQLGVATLTRVFADGLTLMDDYREGLATIAGMIAVTYEGGGNYLDRFTAAHKTFEGSLQQAIRLAPKYRLSMDEITAGFRELAQFGVAVTEENTEKSLNTIAMIREIAATTGSTTRQIRQEIQAIFTGSARVTDQFTKMIQNTMPTVFRQMQDTTLSATERWDLLSDAVWDFNAAVRESNQTVKNQAQIAAKSLSIISMRAIFDSGIFDKWVGEFKKFNEALFDVEGNLLPLGVKIKQIFGNIWARIDASWEALKQFGVVVAGVVQWFRELSDQTKLYIKVGIKAAAVAFALKTSFQILLSTIKGLAAATGLLSLINLFNPKRWAAASAMVAGVAKAIKGLTLRLLAFAAPAGIVVTIIGSIIAVVGGLTYVIGGLAGQWREALDGAIAILKNRFEDIKLRFELIKTDIERLFTPDKEKLKKSLAEQQALLDKFIGFDTDDAGNRLGVFDKQIQTAKTKITKIKGQLNDDLDAKVVELQKEIADNLQEIRDIKIFDWEEFAKDGKNAVMSLVEMLKSPLELFSVKTVATGAVEAGTGNQAMQSALDDMLSKAKGKLETLRNYFYSAFGVGTDNDLPQKVQDLLSRLGAIFNNEGAKFKSMFDTGEVAFSDLGIPRESIDAKKELAKLDTKILEINSKLLGQSKLQERSFITQEELVGKQLQAKKLILDYEKEKLAVIALDVGEEDPQYVRQLKWISKLRREIAGLSTDARLMGISLKEALAVGIIQGANEIKTFGEQATELGKNILPKLSSNFRATFGDVFSGEITKFGSLFDSVMESIEKSFANTMADLVSIYIDQFMKEIVRASATSGSGGWLESIIGGLGGLLTGGSGSAKGMAGGGVIPEHVRGVGESGQLYEFGERGPERVISNSDSFAAPSVQVNIANNSSQRVTDENTSVRFDGRKAIIDVVLEDITQGGKLRKALRG